MSNLKKYKHAQYSLQYCIDKNLPMSEFDKHFLGKHKGWYGRPYRRGKNRCKFCGSPINASDNPNWMSDNLIYTFSKILENNK